jgi:hypothetical protein
MEPARGKRPADADGAASARPTAHGGSPGDQPRGPPSNSQLAGAGRDHALNKRHGRCCNIDRARAQTLLGSRITPCYMAIGLMPTLPTAGLYPSAGLQQVVHEERFDRLCMALFHFPILFGDQHCNGT